MRILIIEDEVRLAEALCQILSKNKYAVDAVHDGARGLDYALSNIYDVIILDIMLPKMNGIEVLRKIREGNDSTPVILLTAKDELSDKVNGLDSGADDYLTKPFMTEELLARVRALNRRRGKVTDDILQYGDISLSLKTSELACNHSTVKLGLKEFLIMQLLLSNGKQIVPKDLLIEKVWGFDSYAEYNNVEVYISFLRKKISSIYSKVEIKTKRGIGYYLEEDT